MASQERQPSQRTQKENSVRAQIASISLLDRTMISGLLDQLPVRILVDSGATHNFIHHRFVQQHQLLMQEGKTVRINGLGNADSQRHYQANSLVIGAQENIYNVKHIDLLHFIEIPPTAKDAIEGVDIVLGKSFQDGEPLFYNARRKAVECGTPPDVVYLNLTEYEDQHQQFLDSQLCCLELDTSKVTNIHVPEVAAYLEEFKEIFQPPERAMLDRPVQHRIPTNSAVPAKMKMRRYPPAEAQEIDKQIQELLAKGYIRESDSPYRAPIVLVNKKGGTKRMCIDYRALNKITVPNTYPLPHIDDLFKKLHGAKYFTSLDLKSGYHQIPVHPDDISKTAFGTVDGLYEYLVMPFGLTGAPATFQAYMNKILKPYKAFVVVYLDDILIFSSSRSQHDRHIRKVLTLLQQHSLHLNSEKCEFFRTKISYLGHVISAEGLSPDPAKTEAVRNWPVPQDKTGLRRFIGLTSYLRRYIPNYAKIAGPLNQLTADKTIFQWTSVAERNWNTTEREAYAAVAALKHFRHYLYGSKTTLYTDHQPLKTLQSNPNPSPKVSRWLDTISEHGTLLNIQHVPGKQNLVADALSRPGLNHVDAQMGTIIAHVLCTTGRNEKECVQLSSLSVGSYVNDLQVSDMKRIALGYQRDHLAQSLISYLKTPNSEEKPTGFSSVNLQNFRLVNGLVYLDDRPTQRSTRIPRLYIPLDPQDPTFRMELIDSYHSSPISGHFGRDRTYDMLRRTYYWPRMEHDVADLVRSCAICQQVKPTNQKTSGMYTALPIPEGRWHTISMDFIEGLPESGKERYNSIVVFVDKFSKMMHAAPLRKPPRETKPLEEVEEEDVRADAEQVAKIFIETVFKHHGLPLQIISDRDRRFTSYFWEHLFDLLKTELRKSTAYHPQTDGQTEKANQVLKYMLQSHCSRKQDTWSDTLAYVEFAYNNAVNASTKFSPFFMNYGKHPIVPAMLNNPTLLHTSDAKVNDFLKELTETLTIAKANLEQANEKYAIQGNKSRKPSQFKVGDKAYVRYEFIRFDGRRKQKLDPIYKGPFEVTELIGPNVVKLDLPASMSRMHNSINVEKLKKHVEGEPIPSLPTPFLNLTPEKIDQIVDCESSNTGQVRYKVKFKPDDTLMPSDTWFTESTLMESCGADWLQNAREHIAKSKNISLIPDILKEVKIPKGRTKNKKSKDEVKSNNGNTKHDESKIQEENTKKNQRKDLTQQKSISKPNRVKKKDKEMQFLDKIQSTRSGRIQKKKMLD